MHFENCEPPCQLTNCPILSFLVSDISSNHINIEIVKFRGQFTNNSHIQKRIIFQYNYFPQDSDSARNNSKEGLSPLHFKDRYFTFITTYQFVFFSFILNLDFLPLFLFVLRKCFYTCQQDKGNMIVTHLIT